MAIGAVQNITVTGLAPVYAAPLATEQVTPKDGLFLHVKNANAGACTVTIDDVGRTPAGSAATDPAVVVPATTGDRMIPLDQRFANPATGTIAVTFSIQASVTAALLRLPTT